MNQSSTKDIAEATRIMVATIGTQDPVSPKTQKPTAPYTLFMEEKPNLVYLIPTAQRPDSKSSSYSNAVETEGKITEWAAKQGLAVKLTILPLDVDSPVDSGEVIPEMERLLKHIEDETRRLPKRQFVITPTSGTPQMREALLRLVSAGMLPESLAYDVPNPDMLEKGESRIRPIELPPAELRKPRIAIFIDHENVPCPNIARRLLTAAEELGDVALAYAGAATLGSKAQTNYADAGFTVLLFPKGPEAADFQLLAHAEFTASARPDIDMFIVVTDDEHFFHGMVSILAQGKKVLFWKRKKTVPEHWLTLQQRYPHSVQIECLPEQLTAARKTETHPKKRTGSELAIIPRRKRKPKPKPKPGLERKLHQHMPPTADEESLRGILLREISHLSDGTVKIKAIARDRGRISKVAVSALQQGIDPVAYCTGFRGVTLNRLREILGGESIYFIPWNADAGIFVASASTPATVQKVMVDEENSRATVFVPADQVSRTIGPGASNVRLISRLTGLHIRVEGAAPAKS